MSGYIFGEKQLKNNELINISHFWIHLLITVRMQSNPKTRKIQFLQKRVLAPSTSDSNFVMTKETKGLEQYPEYSPLDTDIHHFCPSGFAHEKISFKSNDTVSQCSEVMKFTYWTFLTAFLSLSLENLCRENFTVCFIVELYYKSGELQHFAYTHKAHLHLSCNRNELFRTVIVKNNLSKRPIFFQCVWGFPSSCDSTFALGKKSCLECIFKQLP